MLDLTTFQERPIEKEPATCKGLFFRGRINLFYTGARIVEQKELRFLSGRSCSGCPKCGFFHEYLTEDFSSFLKDRNSFNFDAIEHGALYTLKVVVDSVDWQSGHADDWHVECVKVK